MKQAIQQEAEKAAKKIREALEEFNRVTGLSANIDACWALLYQMGVSETTVLLERVDVQPIHSVVRA